MPSAFCNPTVSAIQQHPATLDDFSVQHSATQQLSETNFEPLIGQRPSEVLDNKQEEVLDIGASHSVSWMWY
jgi:hypothetical protein